MDETGYLEVGKNEMSVMSLEILHPLNKVYCQPF